MQVCTYVHGTLYSLLSRPAIRRAAQDMGMDDILQAQMKVSDDDMRHQLEYIIQQLRSAVPCKCQTLRWATPLR